MAKIKRNIPIFFIYFCAGEDRKTGLTDLNKVLKFPHQDKDSDSEELIGKLERKILRMK